MNLSGVWVAVVSFFNEDFSLDLPAFKNHCQWLMDSGVDGLVPCGTTGEGPTLSSSERAQLVEAALSVTSNRPNKKVIVGCGSNNTATTQILLNQAAEMGAHAGLVVTPYYNKPTQAGLLAHYRTLADHSKIPIVLYNVPSRTGVNLAPETVHTLWQHPNIIGLKEATGNHSQWLSLTSPSIPSGKFLLAGDDDAYATLTALGASGIISASANVAPELFVRLHQHLSQENWAEAFKLQKQLMGLIQSFFSETNPGPIKYALSRLKKGKNRLRLPLVSVAPETEHKIAAQLKIWELIP